MRNTFISYAVTLALCLKGATQDQLTVCDVLLNIKKLRGTTAEISGRLIGGRRHGFALVSDPPDSKCLVSSLAGSGWSQKIAVSEYVFGDDLPDGPATFESDVQQIDRTLGPARALLNSGHPARIEVTLIGEIRSRPRIKIRKSKQGWDYGNGYGQAGQYPALLVLKSVKYVQILNAGAR